MDYREDFHKYNLPAHMFEGTMLYIEHGIPMGSFGTMLFSNDRIKDVIAAADVVNQDSIVDWVKYIYNSVPGACQGSAERVQDWIEQGGLNGRG